MADFEKLGAFFLGKEYDLEEGRVADDLVLYDAKDLTTHAVCVGMTGSGKTGLCVSLLEEAAIDAVPAICIDPKGDLGNLMLTFPGLSPDEFRPWIEESAASRKGMTPDEYASHVARTWREGLASWGQDGERVARLKAAADVAIYTPGSSAGLPLAVLRSFDAPPQALREDDDALRERVLGAVSGLLALVGVDADPVRSREHILLSTIVVKHWSEGRDLSLPGLIREIQDPPFERVGVFDVESFYPSKERIGLAMTLNNLLASPGFAGWLEGEPLDVQSLLWTPEGRPRISILSIAHLSDPERMFFVTLLLNEVVAWMRMQSGSSSLRALLYMDEVFGYFPPTSNPPSKTPMLTLMKQARAFGLGVVLATQNPVDLDYKGLSNAGTWFLGRLQTERDKKRVLDGLEGVAASASGNFDRRRIEQTLAGLDSRVFLMNNVHDDGPVIFHTRWAMSYLRGPLTRTQIATLMKDRKRAAAATPAAAVRTAAAPAAAEASRPVLPPGVVEAYLNATRAGGAGSSLVYRPALYGVAKLHYVSARYKVDEWSGAAVVLPLSDEGDIRAAPWDEADEADQLPARLDDAPQAGARYSAVPADVLNAKSWPRWQKSLAAGLYRSRRLILWRNDELKMTSAAGETESAFRARLAQLARERRDVALEKLRDRYAPKRKRLVDRIRRAEEKVERERSQLRHQKTQSVISAGATVLGALFGRKVFSSGSVGRATTAARGMSRASREKEDVARAEESVETLQEELAALEQELEERVDELGEKIDPTAFELEERDVRPRKSDTVIETVGLLWRPYRIDASGVAHPVFD